jgi:hypothetical protein
LHSSRDARHSSLDARHSCTAVHVESGSYTFILWQKTKKRATHNQYFKEFALLTGAVEKALLYSVGFVLGTGGLHALGIALGLLHRWYVGQLALRVAGAAVAVAGGVFLWRAVL